MEVNPQATATPQSALTQEPAGAPAPAVPPLLPPIATSTLLVDHDREVEQARKLEHLERLNAILRAFSCKNPPAPPDAHPNAAP